MLFIEMDPKKTGKIEIKDIEKLLSKLAGTLKIKVPPTEAIMDTKKNYEKPPKDKLS